MAMQGRTIPWPLLFNLYNSPARKEEIQPLSSHPPAQKLKIQEWPKVNHCIFWGLSDMGPAWPLLVLALEPTVWLSCLSTLGFFQSELPFYVLTIWMKTLTSCHRIREKGLNCTNRISHGSQEWAGLENWLMAYLRNPHPSFSFANLILLPVEGSL